MARDDLPEGVVTFLLTDIEGSTRLLRQLGEEAYAEALSAHRSLLRSAFAEHGGVEVDTQGDAFLIAFRTAPDAALGAVAAQRRLAAHDWRATAGLDAPVRVRMGLHTGPAERTDEGYVGMSLHTAARIASAAHGGQILISDAVADAVGDSALGDAGLTLRDLGEHRLKDVDGTQRLLQFVIPELRSDFSPPRSLATHPNNLPVPPTPFIGRAALVAELRDLMLRDDVRLATLVGPGGTGKSRIGLRVATELLHHFEDGAFFVPLASLADPALVPATIASTLGIREVDDKPIIDSIADALRDRHLLLLIDNSEQVQAAARYIGTLLQACPNLKAIVTSREALRLSGARTIRVPPFDLPDPDRLPALDVLAQVESVRLFVERARAAREDFELTTDNAADIAGICRRVDALPLAIELAASRIRTMNPDRLLRALQHRFKVLTGGADDLLDHQKSLRELISWSYDLLTDDEQLLWRRLSVFVGGCTLDAANRVCSPDGAFDVELDIESLVDKSLVSLTTEHAQTGVLKLLDDGPAEPRATMLDTLREFALEQMLASEEADELLERYCDWCLEFAKQAEPELQGASADVWTRQLEREHNNFRGALEHILQGRADQAPLALALTATLWWFWSERGYLSEASNWLRQATNANPDLQDPHRAKAAIGLATIARQQVQLDTAQRYASEALGQYEAAGDDPGIANALGQLGAIAVGSGDNDAGAAYLDRALDILRPMAGEKSRLSFVLVARGVIDHLAGDLDGAKARYSEALDVGSELGNKDSIATALVNLGEIAEAEGRVEDAYGHYRDSLALYAALGYNIAIAYSMEVLAGLDCNHMGRPSRAATLLGAADALREAMAAPIEAFNAERLQRDLAATRVALGDEAFDSAFREGRELDAGAVIRQTLD